MKKFFMFFLAFTFVFSVSFVSAGELKNLGSKIYEALSGLEYAYYKKPTLEQETAFTKALEGTINDILRKYFDEHSRFSFTPSGKTVQEKIEGKYVGIGVLIEAHPKDVVDSANALSELFRKYNKDWLKDASEGFSREDKKRIGELSFIRFGFLVGSRGIHVSQVFKNGGAYLAGVRRGWSIISVENEKRKLTSVVGMPRADAIRLIIGEHLKDGSEGTFVKIKFKKPDGAEIVLLILRRKVAPETVLKEMKTQGIGYIRINSFGFNTAKEFESAVADLKSQGMKKMVIDVRGNPGGFVDSVDGVLDRLVPPGKILIFTETRGNKKVFMWSDSQVPVIFEGPIAVLTDGRSASASEILAGVLKDHGLATLIGEKTYGKGVGQSFGNLKNGGEFRITAFEYILPVSGYRVNKKGIYPDVPAKDDPRTREDEVLEMSLEVLKTR